MRGTSSEWRVIYDWAGLIRVFSHLSATVCLIHYLPFFLNERESPTGDKCAVLRPEAALMKQSRSFVEVLVFCAGTAFSICRCFLLVHTNTGQSQIMWLFAESPIWIRRETHLDLHSKLSINCVLSFSFPGFLSLLTWVSVSFYISRYRFSFQSLSYSPLLTLYNDYPMNKY